MSLDNAPAPAQANEALIRDGITAQDRSDSVLASALYECWSYQYYRAHGFRSIDEYLKEKLGVTGVHVRVLQRLVRERRLAKSIPVFEANFDKINRSRRRILAMILSPDDQEGAKKWVELALKLTSRQLEAAVKAALDGGDTEGLAPSDDKPIRKVLMLFPGQRKVFDEAMDVAGRLMAEDGRDPNAAGAEGMKVEMLAAEFLATYTDAGTGPVACPACQRPSRLALQETQDVDGRRMQIYRCASCQAASVLTTMGA